ncbi:MAG: peptidoglycan DD-metalloendopeptidase family protein [Bacteroidia bacterium]|nr:peptidoglycan DD-metalloendopeptidase family protein [Bacteroidia bacterium]
MKRLHAILFLIFFTVNFYAFSQSSPNVIKEVPDTNSVGPQEDDELDPVDAVTATNEYFKIIKDNNLDVPAYNQYFFWDTLDIHPYQSKMNKFTETRILSLLDSNSVFAMPMNRKPINSNFGWRKWKYHYGIDLGLNVGDSIVSTFDGMVRVVRKSKSYGNVVVIRHNNGLETLYAHLSKALVKPNQEVRAGELIALGGNTGHSTGPHLHFEIRYLGGPINPSEIIDFNNFTLVSDTLIVDRCRFEYLDDVQKARYYTIRKGDTLGRIAKRNGVSISRLCKLNGITRKTTLRIGRRLRYT